MIPNFTTNLKCRRLGFVMAVVALGLTSVLLFAGAQTAHAQTLNCMEDNWAAADNNQSLQCTAKEVFIDEDPVTGDKLIDVTIIDGCDLPGDTATVDIVASIHFNSDRLDVGVYSALDGGNALTGECAVDILDPNNPVDLVDGPGSTTVAGTTGSFDVKPATPPTQDACGDADIFGGGGGNLDAFAFQRLTLECIDEDGDGFLDFSTCFSWRVDGSDDFCDGTQSDVYPGTPSKCFCETTNIDVPVPQAATIEVIKDVEPDWAAGKFNLQVDEVTKFADAMDSDSTGKVMVSAGTNQNPGADHTVGETAGTDTDLATYDSSIECVDRGTTNVVASSSDTGPLTVNVQPDDDIVCTITNTRKAGNITVTKTGEDLTKVGDEVSYTVTIANDGDGQFPLQLDTITDSLAGDLKVNFTSSTCDSLTDYILPAGASCTITYTHTVATGDVIPDPSGQGGPDVVKNTVTVVASDPNDPGPDLVTVTDSDDKFVNIFVPAITFSKTGSPTTMVEGTQTNYEITLMGASTSNTPLMDCTITDLALGINENVVLTPMGEVELTPSKVWDFDGTDSAFCELVGEQYECTNTAEVSCEVRGFEGINQLEEEASVTVTVIPADVALSITKDCSDYSKVNTWEGWTAADAIDYQIVITNETPSLPLTLVAINDTVLGTLDPNTECTNPLPAGQSCTINKEYIVTQDGDEVTNEVTVTFNDGLGGGNITFPGPNDTPVTCTTDLLHPNLTVAKSCASTDPVPSGATANFEIKVTNTGDVDLEIDVSDPAPFTPPIDLVDVLLGTAPNGCVDGDYGNGATPELDATDGCLLLEGGITATGTQVSNTVNVTATLPVIFGLSNVLTRTNSDTCDVQQGDATRTWGFWKTHGSDGDLFEDPVAFGYTCHVFEDHLGGTMDLGWKTVESCEDLFAIFWAHRAKESDGDRRSNVCQAQVRCSGQVAAALLNTGLDNGAPLDPDDLAAVLDALATGNRRDINQACAPIAAYNESGDDAMIIDNDGAMIPHADPNGTRDEANFPFADCNQP